MKNIYNSEYSIIKFSPKYLAAIINLYRHSYIGRKLPKNYFEYRLWTSPYGKPIIYLMKFQNKIVGFYAIHPIKLRIKNENYLGGYSYLTMVHPSHSGRGIFTKLAKETYEEAKKKGYQFVYGFANKNSYPNFITRLGFKELTPINFVRITPSKNFKKKNFKLISRFPKNLTKIWKDYEAKNKFSIKVDRNDRFLIWRYKKHPIFQYYTSYEDQNYFAVFKKYLDTLHVIDFFGKDENFYERLLNDASNYCFKLLCKEITMWIPEKHEIMKSLKRDTYQQLSWDKSYFIVKILNNSLTKRIENIKNWYYTMGDADHF